MLTTKLDAVNWILRALGEQPVVSTIGQLPINAAMALSEIEKSTSDVLEEGWAFNVDKNVSLAPDNAGRITIPADAIRAKFLRTSAVQDEVVERYEDQYRRAFNTTQQTFVFTAAVTADLTRHFDFERLPQAARRYITAKAGVKIVDGLNGSRETHAYLRNEEAEARAGLHRASDAARLNANIFQSYAAFRAIDRQYPGAGSGGLLQY